MSEKKQIRISEVLELLEQGKKRKEIAEYYGITMSALKKVFNHPKLKGKKAHKAPEFELVDDTQEVQETASATTDEDWNTPVTSEEVQA